MPNVLPDHQTAFDAEHVLRAFLDALSTQPGEPRSYPMFADPDMWTHGDGDALVTVTLAQDVAEGLVDFEHWEDPRPNPIFVSAENPRTVSEATYADLCAAVVCDARRFLAELWANEDGFQNEDDRLDAEEDGRPVHVFYRDQFLSLLYSFLIHGEKMRVDGLTLGEAITAHQSRD